MDGTRAESGVTGAADRRGPVGSAVGRGQAFWNGLDRAGKVATALTAIATACGMAAWGLYALFGAVNDAHDVAPHLSRLDTATVQNRRAIQSVADKMQALEAWRLNREAQDSTLLARISRLDTALRATAQRMDDVQRQQARIECYVEALAKVAGHDNPYACSRH